MEGSTSSVGHCGKHMNVKGITSVGYSSHSNAVGMSCSDVLTANNTQIFHVAPTVIIIQKENSLHSVVIILSYT